MIGFRTDIKLNKDIKELSIWNHIIKQWQKINRDYLEDYNFEDSLYWYNERANISCLAGAIWKIGGYAQEEYSATKGEEKTTGRIDLYFSVDETEYIVEAKHLWINFNTKSKKLDDFEDVIQNSLNKAINDCKNSMMNYETINGVGLVFITPYWDIKLDKNQELLNFEKELLEQKFDIIGTFAIGMHEVDSYSLNSSDYTCNAVYIIGKYLPKSSS